MEDITFTWHAPASVAGRGRVRPQLFQFFNGLPEVHLVEGYMSDEEYRENLKNSKFCLCPRGNEVGVLYTGDEVTIYIHIHYYSSATRDLHTRTTICPT